MSASGVDVHECLLDLPVRLTSLENGLGAVTKDEDVIQGDKQRIVASQSLRDPELLVSRSALEVVSVLSLLRKIKSPVLSTRLKIHLLATSVEAAKSVDSLDGTVSPEADADGLLTLWAIFLTGDVIFGCDVGEVVVRVLAQEPEVFRRAVDDVLRGHAGFYACAAEVTAGPGDEGVYHFDLLFSAPAMRLLTMEIVRKMAGQCPDIVNTRHLDLTQFPCHLFVCSKQTHSNCEWLILERLVLLRLPWETKSL